MTSKQTDGIKFTDKDGNIITDDNDEDDGNTYIPVANNTND